MDEFVQTNMKNLRSGDSALQNKAYSVLMEATEKPVNWAYDVWDDIVADLTHKDNHRRAIAAQVLANLAKSDPENRILRDFDALLNVTKDERFVTARHCIQSIWKVGAVGKLQQQMLVDGLAGRFKECISEKNCTLIRYDILVGLRNLYDQVQDDTIRAKALALIDTEEDVKYLKKYEAIWRRA